VEESIGAAERSIGTVQGSIGAVEGSIGTVEASIGAVKASIGAAQPTPRPALLFFRPSDLLFRALKALDDRTLMAGFVAGARNRTHELLERLVPPMKQELERRRLALRELHEDILSEILVTRLSNPRDLTAGPKRPTVDGG
jgi:hypothetical protein